VEKKKKARNAPSERPNATHILLDAISGALRGGVAVNEVIWMIEMASEAHGTDQSTSWKLVASKLRKSTANANQNVAQQLTDATRTLPDDSPDAG
jgi:hypothetical protein